MNADGKFRFLTSAPTFSALPSDCGAELAFAGRSNAGKSSVLNTLANNRKLTKTSSTPGKTRHINLFALEGAEHRRLTDLPGYGFARVRAADQHRWERELTRYILERKSLKAVVIVMDIRHPLTGIDRQMMELCRNGGRKIHVLLNKADKLKRGGIMSTRQKVARELLQFDPQATLGVFSASKREGIKELWNVLHMEWAMPQGSPTPPLY